jgi:hypothetical protein
MNWRTVVPLLIVLAAAAVYGLAMLVPDWLVPALVVITPMLFAAAILVDWRQDAADIRQPCNPQDPDDG